MVLSFGEVLMDCFPDKNVIGGAPFNVAVHLKRLGEQAGIITKVGDDELGSQIHEILIREGLTAQLQIDENYPTGRVDVTLKNGQPSYHIHQGCGWEYIGVNKIAAPNYFVFGSLALFFEENKKSFNEYRNQFEKATFVCDLNLLIIMNDDVCLLVFQSPESRLIRYARPPSKKKIMVTLI